ncbi:TetR/AcrR family transcriptional regulator C-terminal domain-containing protein [Helicovermis profundi]|uniref:TetR/AcrR family transcriptional regulator n=1 Tax=Helicovermis profundi TaxID=3065157 RepID=A0AAU9E979_9FIRM|nr:TetR/AcrR family transcriptional regulator [Clostridia bacterium S502]
MSDVTKKALAKSLKKIMLNKPLDKITINDITSESGFNRRTLYYHFQDIYDLLEWTLKTEISDILGKNKTYNTWQKGFLELLNYLNDNKKIILNIYATINRDYIESHLISDVTVLILNVINEVSSNLEVSDISKNKIAKFYEIALVGIILDWIKNKMETDPKVIVEDLDIILDGDIYNALCKYKENEG